MAAPSILLFGSAVRLDIYHNILGSVVALIVIQELRQHYSEFFSTDDTSSKSFCHLIIYYYQMAKALTRGVVCASYFLEI